jgi:class 3 adenylate cyclase
VSYVRDDQRKVDELCTIFKQNDIAVWLDREKIRPGERWQVAIRRAIEEGAFFIACFSTAYNAREKSYMNVELTIAIDQLRFRPTDRAWFIPILFEGGVVPDKPIGGGETLRDIQWVNLAEDWDNGIERILSVLRPTQTTPTAPPSNEAETALVILMIDLVGLSSTMEQLGDMEFKGIMDQLLSLLFGAIAEHRGETIKSMGDGLTAAFKLVPDAIRCAQQIQDVLTNSEHLQNLRVRIGIAAGPVIELYGNISGTTAHIAARVCSLAGSGQILITESVRALGVGEGVPLTELGAVNLKGHFEPVHIYEVNRPKIVGYPSF